jgi:hypothetical protein
MGPGIVRKRRLVGAPEKRAPAVADLLSIASSVHQLSAIGVFFKRFF